MSVIVDRALRDHVRYTGDGLPSAPTGAPLPIGDPASGVHHPRKKDLRDALNSAIDGAAAAASEEFAEGVGEALAAAAVADGKAVVADGKAVVADGKAVVADGKAVAAQAAANLVTARVDAALPDFDAPPEMIPLITTDEEVLLWLDDGEIDGPALAPNLRQSAVSDIVSRMDFDEAGTVPLMLAGDAVIMWMDEDGIHGAFADGPDPLVIAEPRRSPLVSQLPICTDGRSLHRYRAQKGRIRGAVAGSQIRMTIGYDSWGEMINIPAAFRAIMDAAYGHCGEGFRSARAGDRFGDPIYTLGSGWTTVDGSTTLVHPYGAGPDGQSIWTNTTTASLTYTGIQCTDISIYYNKNGGTFRWRVDAGSWTSVTSDSSGTKGTVTVSGLADALHDLEIDTSGNAGIVSLLGYYSTRAGVIGSEVSKVGNGGLTGYELSAFTTHIDHAIADIYPDLHVTFLGTNDVLAANSTPDVYIAALAEMVAAYRVAVPDIGFIFVAPARSNPAGVIVTPLLAYRDALYDWCIAEGHEFYNMYDDWPDYATANALGQWADTVHVTTNAGAHNLARRMTELFNLI